MAILFGLSILLLEPEHPSDPRPKWQMSSTLRWYILRTVNSQICFIAPIMIPPVPCKKTFASFFRQIPLRLFVTRRSWDDLSVKLNFHDPVINSLSLPQGKRTFTVSNTEFSRRIHCAIFTQKTILESTDSEKKSLLTNKKLSTLDVLFRNPRH